jgi:uncharacterized alkaline shock family protein YloU
VSAPTPVPALSVSHSVIARMVRRAAVEAPGVLRVSSGGSWLSRLTSPAVAVRTHDGRIRVRISVVVRPGHDLRTVAEDIRSAVAATVERLLGLELEDVTVVVDGVGG